MSEKRKWHIWSVSGDETMAIVVGEGTRKYCEESADRRNASLAKFSMPGCFAALPAGEKPEGMG